MNKTFAVVLFLFSCLTSYASKLDSFLIATHSFSDSLRVDSAIKTARHFAMNQDGVNGELFARWALETSDEIKNRNLKARARFYLAASYNNLGMSDSCVTNYDRALVDMQGTLYESWKVHVFINAIGSYRNVGKYKKALNSGFEALKYYEEKSDTDAVADFSTSIGYVYDRMKDFDKAIEWHKKAIELYKKLNDTAAIYFVYGRVGIANDDLGNYDSAHYYNTLALNYHIAKKDSFSIAMTSSNIGNTNMKQENWQEALKHLKRATIINEIHGDKGSRAISKINLAYVYINTGNYALAKKYLSLGLKSAIDWGGVKYQSEGYYRYHQLYEKTKQFDSALFYFKKYELLKDTLYGIEKTKKIEELETIYETEKKEQKIEIQKITLQQKEEKLAARQRTIVALVIISILIIIIAIGLLQKTRAKKNAEIQETIIREQEKGLNAVLMAQEEERRRISKDLHDGVGQQLSGLKMAFQKLATNISTKLPKEQNELAILTGIVNDSAEEVRSISHQMMPRALTELGLIPAIEDMLSKSLATNEIKYEFEYFKVENRLAEKIEISLYRIVQELINNIIKHSGASFVSVQLFKNNKHIVLIVEDNGKGIQKSSSEGHGLLNIKSRLNTIKGKVNYEPSPNSGTTATVRVPLEV